MQIGLLWFDSDPQRALAVKVEAAANRYREKFGKVPDTCYVNQTELKYGEDLVLKLAGTVKGPVRLVPVHNILPHHFWVGVEEGLRPDA